MFTWFLVTSCWNDRLSCSFGLLTSSSEARRHAGAVGQVRQCTLKSNWQIYIDCNRLVTLYSLSSPTHDILCACKMCAWTSVKQLSIPGAHNCWTEIQLFVHSDSCSSYISAFQLIAAEYDGASCLNIL